ncbi:MAG: DapH/DapD/GlmU-related protein [Candidatus Nanohaloarchaea archaeon]|nr:DapH/DapD/GlmU-related protein [Candidatus Nanohaloarchaea archaeon]
MTEERQHEQVPAHHWTRVRNPLRVIFNAFICELCKYLPSTRIKNILYRMIGVDIGERVVIAPHVQIDPFAPEAISIGDDTVIGWGTDIFTHEFLDGTFTVKTIDIGEGCTIGGRSFIRSGSEIGDGAIVGIKALVNGTVDEDEVVGGVPQHHLRDRDDTTDE